MSSSLTSTLRHVTNRKLEKLATQQQRFEAQKKDILDAVRSEQDDLKKLRILMDKHDKHGIEYHKSDFNVTNIQKALGLAERQGSISPSLLQEWIQWFERNLDIHSARYYYTDLFGRIVTEWIENPNEGTSHAAAASDSDYGSFDSDDSSNTESLQEIGREAMHTTRQALEDLWFNRPNIDVDALRSYLDDLFAQTSKSRKLQVTPLDAMRKYIGSLKDITVVLLEDVQAAIKAVLAADLYNGSKRQALVDLESRPEVLQEMVDVLSMDLRSISTWKWEEPVPIYLRRQLNMKYRAYMDEEFHLAILFQLVGGRFAATIRGALVTHFHSGAWQQSPFQAMGKDDSLRRQYYLGKQNERPPGDRDSVRSLRRLEYFEKYFMTNLPSQVDQADEYALDRDEGASDKNPVAIKQDLLRLITTEMLLNTEPYGEFTVLQTDFKFFGPSLPHESILTVLEYFGVDKKWLEFFHKFLRAPLMFAQDGPDSESQTRTCGVPMSHVLSTVFGETVLFCLDFAVNQKTQGANIYRLHDDVWFWGQEETCISAWAAIQEFADIAGLDINMDKTSSAKVFHEDRPKQLRRSISDALPTGKVSWGFLLLDSTKGFWTINKKLVDKHITELRLQLDACRSSMAWVQAWNSYVINFLMYNFGDPARCLGRKHLEQVIRTFEYLQHQVFDSDGHENGKDFGPHEHLRRRLMVNFGTSDIPDGFLYWPYEFGGMELRNPFIALQAVLENTRKKTPRERVIMSFEADEQDWEKLKRDWEDGNRPSDQPRNLPANIERSIKDDDSFMSLHEFVNFREQTSAHLAAAYLELLQKDEAAPMDQPSVIPSTRAFKTNGISERKLAQRWRETDRYWQWIFALYSPEMLRKFGDLAIGDRGILPIGLIEMLKGEKTRWRS